MKMRGAASSPSALCWRISSARLVSLPTSRMVVMPQASQMLSSYSSGCGLPPRSSCRCACALISPGRTYLPVASITASASAPPRAGMREPRAAATGSSGITSAIVLFSMTMSLGPLAGVPLPSTTMALWISRRRTRLPLAGACGGAWAAAEQARESAARETSRVRDMGTIVACYGEGEQSTGLRLDPAARRQGGGAGGGRRAGFGTWERLWHAMGRVRNRPGCDSIRQRGGRGEVAVTGSNQRGLAPRERARGEGRGMTIWVTAREAFWIALEALRGHKLRSFLTLLGVVIATTTLIVVMSIVNGMNLYIAEHIANLCTNTFVLHQFQWAQGFDSFLTARRRNQPIRVEDYEFLRDNLQGYQQIGAMSQLSPNPPARYKGRMIDEITLNAMTPSFADIGREKIEKGRYISDADYQHNARVCVIGQDLVEKLFPDADPLDKEVSLAGLSSAQTSLSQGY